MTIKTKNITIELNGYLFIRAFGYDLFKTQGERMIISKVVTP